MLHRITASLTLTAALLSAFGGAQAAPPPRARIELRDGWYFLDGQKTLINAIGYESGARPGEVPYAKPTRDLAQVKADLQRIKAAGFNGIRTWLELEESELQVVQASGLKILFGIWLEPDKDFSDPAVVAKDLALLRRVLATTRKYDCVITYIIMNEPMPEHLHRVGAQATRDLWARAVELIHQLHPGVPVTISGNSAITEWVDLNVFDVYARNAYDYRDGSSYTHGFANSQRAYTEHLGQGKPAVLTEFGRSVSRRANKPFYGGNTLQQQADAMLRYYRDILDSGATGLCPFYFADGWWKAGAPAVHDDEAEEWFGFHGFGDGKDDRGMARPAWHALERYNQALIASPKNQTFYLNTVPVEAFCQPAVKRLRVLYQDRMLLDARPDARGHYTGRLSFAGEPLQDRELVVEAYDGRGRLLKVESIIVLTGREPIQWPLLELRSSTGEVALAREVSVDLCLSNPTVFTLGPELRYAFSPHKGWDRPEERALRLNPAAKEQAFSDRYLVPEACVVLSVFAGTEIRFGRFVKTVYAQRFFYRGNWADPIRLKDQEKSLFTGPFPPGSAGAP